MVCEQKSDGFFFIVKFLSVCLQKSTNLLHDSEFCAWKKMVEPTAKCNCTTASAPRLQFDGCELTPVSPKPYTQ